MLSVSLVPRLWSSPPRTMGDWWLCNYQQQQQQQQNFINKQINLQKYCPQLTRLFEAGQCVQNIKIETKAINIIILKLRTRYLPVKASSEHCCLMKGLCQNSPSLPHKFWPHAWSTHPLLGQSLGYPAKPTKTASPLTVLDTGLAWCQAVPGAKRKPSDQSF